MNDNMFISIIMPVYNCEKYLSEAIESILNQTYLNFEFIIVNDGSTDNSINIINNYSFKDKRIRIVDQINSGIVVALNRGLAEAKGNWIARMDGDDIALPHRIALQVEIIKKNPSIVLLGGWCNEINGEGTLLKTHRYPSDNNNLIQALENGKAFFPHPTVLFSKSIAQQVGGYRERFRHAEDHDLWLRLSTLGKFGCCDNVILQLRKHTANISNLNFGYVQQLKAFAARVCHFRRKAGLSDLSVMDENIWINFVNWLENRLQEEKYFEIHRGWQSLRAAWYSEEHKNQKSKKINLFIRELYKNSSARKALIERFSKTYLVKKIAIESNISFE